jgi:hypothetical protein
MYYWFPFISLSSAEPELPDNGEAKGEEVNGRKHAKLAARGREEMNRRRS